MPRGDRHSRSVGARAVGAKLQLGSGEHLAKDPQASPAKRRCEMFQRLYGHEFGADQREKILARLGRDA